MVGFKPFGFTLRRLVHLGLSWVACLIYSTNCNEHCLNIRLLTCAHSTSSRVCCQQKHVRDHCMFMGPYAELVPCHDPCHVCTNYRLQSGLIKVGGAAVCH